MPRTLTAKITNVDTDTLIASEEIASTGTLDGNFEALNDWATSKGHPIERRFGCTLSGKAQDGILVQVEVKYHD